MQIPGGTPFEPVIGKEGFDTKAVDAATPPTAAATGAFFIKKSKISLRASTLSLVVVCSCLQIGLQLIVTVTLNIVRPKVARPHPVSFQAISVRPCTTEKNMLKYVCKCKLFYWDKYNKFKQQQKVLLAKGSLNKSMQSCWPPVPSSLSGWPLLYELNRIGSPDNQTNCPSCRNMILRSIFIIIWLSVNKEPYQCHACICTNPRLCYYTLCYTHAGPIYQLLDW